MIFFWVDNGCPDRSWNAYRSSRRTFHARDIAERTMSDILPKSERKMGGRDVAQECSEIWGSC
jgi:hypothetical protein